MVQTPCFRSNEAVRSIKESCLERMILFGEDALRKVSVAALRGYGAMA